MTRVKLPSLHNRDSFNSTQLFRGGRILMDFAAAAILGVFLYQGNLEQEHAIMRRLSDPPRMPWDWPWGHVITTGWMRRLISRPFPSLLLLHSVWGGSCCISRLSWSKLKNWKKNCVSVNLLPLKTYFIMREALMSDVTDSQPEPKPSLRRVTCIKPSSLI